MLLCVMQVASVAHAATIVVDTGHSPVSSGSKASDGTPEFTLNRNLAVKVIEALKDKGHNVVDVHGTGSDRTLGSRTRQTGAADLFISIHHDSIQQFLIDEGRAPEFSGFSVFISGLSKNLRGSLKCAVHVGDSMVAAGEKPSRYHAAPIKGENRPLLDDRRGIHRYDHLAVLKASLSPAILLEAGVGVNPYEIGKLQSPEWTLKVATELAEGISRCVPATATASKR